MRRFVLFAAVCAVAALIAPAMASATVRYVATGGDDTSNDCTGAANPCRHIQHAVDQANEGDTIQIGAGTYAESVSTAKSLDVIGAGAGTGLDATKVAAPVSSTDSAGNAALALGAGSSIASLQAIGGDAGASTLPFGQSGGDGILISLAVAGQRSTTITDVAATGGAGSSPGGAFPFPGPGGFGIAVASSGSDAANEVEITHSTLDSGPATFGGGTAALWVAGAGAGVTAADLEVNASPGPLLGAGVGVQVLSGARTSVSASIVEAGIGAEVAGGSLTISGSTVHGSGFGVWVVPSSPSGASADVADSLVTAEDPTSGGIAAEVQTAAPGQSALLTARGSTFAGTGGTGAVVANRLAPTDGPAEVKLRNSTALHTPASGTPPADLLADGGSITADFSSFTHAVAKNGGSAPAPGGAANIAGDPGFTDPANGDFTLRGDSPLIDRGDPAAVDPGELDLAGSPRSLDGNRDCIAVPDIGAYERTGQGAACPLPSLPADAAPTISHFRLSHRVFAPKAKRKHRSKRASASMRRRKKVKRGTTFVYTLSERARLTIVIERRKASRKHRHKHSRHNGKSRARAKGKARFVKVGTLKAQGHSGRQSTPFSGRVKGKPLRPGRYRAQIVATDAAGQRSAPRRASFRIVRG